MLTDIKKEVNDSKSDLISDNHQKDEVSKQMDKPIFDDSAEMFQGLFTGDEHYHSRSAEFVHLWG